MMQRVLKPTKNRSLYQINDDFEKIFNKADCMLRKSY